MNNTTPNDNKQRHPHQVLPLWRIRGGLTLVTPLSIGTGHEESVHDDKQDHFIALIARDHSGNPYLPGSSIKGALRAMAQRCGLDRDMLDKLFGSVDDGITTPAQLEFCNAYLTENNPPPNSNLPGFDPEKQTAQLPHSVRDRNYGTVVEKLFFFEHVVPPGYQFKFECTAQNLSEDDIATLLALLDLAGSSDSGFQLGARKASDNGRVQWEKRDVHCVKNFDALWQAIRTNSAANANLWDYGTVKPIRARTPLSSGDLLVMGSLALKFHTPFLVYQKTNKHPGTDGGADGQPRTNHAGKPVLPASSLHGALRSQAERILRTLGEETPEGYKVPAVFGLNNIANLDLASVLFGATGWRGVLQCSDFVAPTNAPKLKHEMVAIDRLTGGGKDSAKFCIEALDCPTLTGSIRLDLGRLRQLAHLNPNIEAQCLGLLAHVLRDLDEGDIALGYGKAKGYGISHSETVVALNSALNTSSTHPSMDVALKAFADAMLPTATVTGQGLQSTLPSTNIQPPVITPTLGDFHNPYVFLPLPILSQNDARLPWANYAKIPSSHHSHAAYHAQALHGRIVCKLTTQTPVFVGAANVANTQDPKQKENFKLNKQIALPATSLRGMLSSLHESISRSALRVMDDRSYSVRASTSEALQFCGTIKMDQRLIKGVLKSIWVIEERESLTKYTIPDKVLKRLEQLCDERTTESDKRGELLPQVKPIGIPRNRNTVKLINKARLCEGQTMYFTLDNTQQKIVEMAYSQIWRKSVLHNDQLWKTSHALPASDLAVFTSERLLSPSEMLFGLVQDMGEDYKKLSVEEKTKNPARVFASKVRFGFGMAISSVQPEAIVTLKILASPKPPSPAMYFKQKTGQAAYISKVELAKNPSKYILQGRKAYLHGLRDTNGETQKLTTNGEKAPVGQGVLPWVSEQAQRDAQQKVRVTPIPKGEDFYFEVDFANLNQAELESLCATLQPNTQYEHKLGMGKPIGLGSVKIEIIGLFLINRQARYRQVNFSGTSPQAQRYDTVWKCVGFPAKLPDHLSRENNAMPTDANQTTPEQLAQNQMAALKATDPALYWAICLTGTPGAVKKPVHYPQVRGRPIETETYRWFVENDRINHVPKQHLKPFTETSTCLPTLNRMP